MVISIYPECKLLLYADDRDILFSYKDPDVIADKLGKVLESCSSWLVDNKLSLHLRKTESILFGALNENLGRLNVFKFPVMDSLLILLIMLNISA